MFLFTLGNRKADCKFDLFKYGLKKKAKFDLYEVFKHTSQSVARKLGLQPSGISSAFDFSPTVQTPLLNVMGISVQAFCSQCLISSHLKGVIATVMLLRNVIMS